MSARRAIARAVMIAGMLAVAGCATRPAPSSSPNADLTGRWEGESRVINCNLSAVRAYGRCNAINHISFSLSQNDGALIGNYHCFIGNMICRNGGADDIGHVSSGWVSGDLVYLTIEIQSDGSTCRFNGHTAGTRFDGGYLCYQGGGLIEVGQFTTSRSWGG